MSNLQPGPCDPPPNHQTVPKPPKRFLTVLQIISLAIIIAAGAYYIASQGALPERQPTAAQRSETSSCCEYVSPFGFRFSYPANFRWAKAYMDLWNRGS